MDGIDTALKVRALIAETIGIRAEDVAPDASIVEDLGADSLDLLDLVFRLEQAFGIRITRGDIERRTRELVPGEDIEKDGLLTDRARAALKEVLPEVDPARIDAAARRGDIPRLFTPTTFVRLVEEKRTQRC